MFKVVKILAFACRWYFSLLVCVSIGGVRMAAAVLVSGPALRPLLQLVDPTDGATGEGLEAHGDHGKSVSRHTACHVTA